MSVVGDWGLETARGAARRLPNLLGIGRILAALLVAWLLWRGLLAEAFWVFILAGLSDAVDGELARRLGVVTRFGTILDPAADKILIGSSYAAAAAADLSPWWLAWLVIGRDGIILLVAGITYFVRPGLLMMPMRVGKISTGLQIFALSTVLAAAAYGWPSGEVGDAALALAAVMTTVSGIVYALNWIRIVRNLAIRPQDPRRP